MSADGITSVWLDGPAGKLDLRMAEPKTPGDRPDLLFVHGAWSSSWYWEPFFLPFFTAQGHRSAAINLRGHGASEGRLRWASITDYVVDLRKAAEHLNDPVIIGHSMGGFVVQKYAQAYPLRAMGLLASVPPMGAWNGLCHVVAHHPGKFLKTWATLDLYPVVEDIDIARKFLFSRDVDQTDKDYLLGNLQSESFRAFLELLIRPILRPLKSRPPCLVIGGEDDLVISKSNLHATAQHYQTTPSIRPAMSHMLPIEDEWREVASEVLEWLQKEVMSAQAHATHHLPRKDRTYGT